MEDVLTQPQVDTLHQIIDDNSIISCLIQLDFDENEMNLYSFVCKPL